MNSRKTNVTLEDLLQLKRAEQPPAEFWDQFERELRAKQLAAIVEPRPWWAPFIGVGAKFAHLQLPLGAAAILAVTFVSVREFGDQEATALEIDSPVAQQLVSAGLEARMELMSASSEERTVDEHTAEIAVVDQPAARPAQVERPSLAATDEIPAPTEGFGLTEMAYGPSPSARYIAANLAAAQEADPRLLDDVFGNTLQHAQSREPIRDPLSHVSSPGESRRSRLLATALPVNSSSSDLSSATTGRVARNLTEQRLYDTISRVGLKGDRVAIKF